MFALLAHLRYEEVRRGQEPSKESRASATVNATTVNATTVTKTPHDNSCASTAPDDSFASYAIKPGIRSVDLRTLSDALQLQLPRWWWGCS